MTNLPYLIYYLKKINATGKNSNIPAMVANRQVLYTGWPPKNGTVDFFRTLL